MKNLKYYLIIVLLFIFQYKSYPSFLREGYYAINGNYLGGNVIGDTVFVYGNNGYFIYSVNEGENWLDSFSGGVKDIAKIITFQENIVVLQDDYIKYKHQLKSNNWQNIALNTKLKSENNDIVDIFNSNNQELIILTKSGEIYSSNKISGTFTLKYQIKDFDTIVKSGKINLIEDKFIISSGSTFFVFDNQFNLIVKITLDCKDCIIENIKSYNVDEYIINSNNTIYFLDNEFNILRQFNFQQKIIGLITNTNEIKVFEQDSNNYWNPFKLYTIVNNELKNYNYAFDRNKISNSEYVKVNTVIDTKFPLIVGDNKLLINTDKKTENYYQLSSYIGSSFRTQIYGGSNTLQLNNNNVVCVLDQFSRPFLSIDNGATWTIPNNYKTSSYISDAAFRIYNDTLLFCKNDPIDRESIVISYDGGITIKKYYSLYVQNEILDIDRVGNDYYLIQNNGFGKWAFASITKLKFTKDSIYYYMDFGNRNNGLTKFDSLYIKNYKIVNENNILIHCIKIDSSGVFKDKLYRISNYGKTIELVGKEEDEFKSLFFISDTDFIGLKQRIDNLNRFYLDIYKSSDKGLTWELKQTAIEADSLIDYNQEIIIDKGKIRLLTNFYELESDDNGEIWKRKSINSVLLYNKISKPNFDIMVGSAIGGSQFILKSIPEDFVSSVEDIEYQTEDLLTLSITNAYPNPTRDNINVSVLFDQRYNMEDAVISILDYLGKPINVQFELNPKSNFQSE
ncbi:MAG: hypothetical protein ACOVNU_09815, partial [Candidatus Kapaibacteriota bacterium]